MSWIIFTSWESIIYKLFEMSEWLWRNPSSIANDPILVWQNASKKFISYLINEVKKGPFEFSWELNICVPLTLLKASILVLHNFSVSNIIKPLFIFTQDVSYSIVASIQ